MRDDEWVDINGIRCSCRFDDDEKPLRICDYHKGPLLRLDACKRVALEWQQGVWDAETAIRKICEIQQLS